MVDEVGRPVLIVIDTSVRNFGPADENSAADMNLFYRLCRWLLASTVPLWW